MPQIWPASWTLLFLFFLVSLVSFLVSLHFVLLPLKPNSNLGVVKQSNKLNWLW